MPNLHHNKLTVVSNSKYILKPIHWLIFIFLVAASFLILVWQPEKKPLTSEQYHALSVGELQEMAAINDPRALVILADYYLEGIKVTFDPQLSRQYLEQAVSLGDSEAQYKLGMLLFNGFKPERTSLSSNRFDSVGQSAQDTDSDSFNDLYGDDYSDSKNYDATESAEGLFADADSSSDLSFIPSDSNTESNRSQFKIAMSRKDAVPLIEQAALKGYVPAFMQLASIYEKGIVKKQSYVEAFKWYSKAAEAGISDAQFIDGNMYHKGRGTRNSEDQALYWFSMAGEQGHAGALYNLGYMYEYGRGVGKDLSKAKEYYGLSCDNGLQKSCNRYRRLNNRDNS